MILDEINLACDIRLLNTKDVVNMLKKVPAETTVIITGRRASKELMKVADYVNEVKGLKRPKNWVAKRGVEF